MTLPDVLQRTAARRGSGEALVTGEARIRYGELAVRVERMAGAMRAMGISRGDHVGLLMGNSVEWVTVFYAAASIGAVTVPLSTRFRVGELRFCLGHADVSALFVAGRFLKMDFAAMLSAIEPALGGSLPGAVLPRLRHVVLVGDGPCPGGAVRYDDVLALTGQDSRSAEGGARQGVNLAGAEDAGLPPSASSVDPDDPLLIQFTSGTTAFPKGVVLTHRGMLMNAASAARRIGVTAEDRYFSIRPFSHVGGSTLTLLVSLVSGATVVTLPSYDVKRALEMMRDERCTLVSGNDTIFQMLLADESCDPSALCLRGGWAAAGPETMRRLIDELGATAMVNAYGLSEASPNVVMNDWRDPRDLRIEGWALPHDGCEVRIVDPSTGAVQPAWQPGEIQTRGWHVMRGYYNQPDATAAAVDADGWLRTGDLGEMDERGRIRMIGRLKEIIRVGGENVSPAEIENVLLGHPAVAVAQVVGAPDTRLVEVPAAYVQVKAGASVTEAELVRWCAERCANFKVPRHLRLVDSFEWSGMTSSGKIPKAAVRARALRDFAPAGARSS